MLKAKSEVVKLNADFALHGPESIVAWMLEKYGSRAAISSSFGPEDMVLTDMALKFDPKARIVTLDTGRLPEATYAVMDAVKFKYNCAIEVFFPNPEAVEKLTRTKGFFSFKESVENRKECCRIRKVEPLKRALGGLDAWITGQRRAQSVTRKNIAKFEIDAVHGNILKVNPLADWDEARVWDYIRKNKVPYNVLFDQGYRSIGCEPCTRAVKEGEDERAGRWWWENPEHKECGLHSRPGVR